MMFLKSLPADTVATLIARGSLTADNINMLDAVQDIGDGDALVVLLSENDKNKYPKKDKFFTALGSIDTTHVSEAMAYKIFTRTKQEQARSEELKDYSNIELIAIAISNQKHNKAQIYTEKMTIAADMYSSVLAADAKALNPRLKGNDRNAVAAFEHQQEANKAELQKINKEMKTVGRLSSLFEAMNVNHVGKDRVKQEKGFISPTVSLETKTIKKGSLKLHMQDGDDKYEFEADYTKNGEEKTPLKIFSERQEGLMSTQASELVADYAKLDEKREKALTNFALDMGTLGLGSKYAFALSSARNLDAFLSEDSSLEKRAQSIGKQHQINKSQFGDKYTNLTGKAPNAIASTGSFISSIMGIDKERKDIEDKVGRNIYNVGGYTITNQTDDTVTTIYRPQYDLQAILQMDDLEKNGMRTYVYHTNKKKGVENGIKALQAFDKAIESYTPIKPDGSSQSVMTEEMQELFAGKGGMAEQNIVDIKKGINYISMSREDIQTDDDRGKGTFGLNGYTYNTEDYMTDRQDFFRDLVGDSK